MSIANQFEFGHFKWWIGVVEDRGGSCGKAPEDEHKMGRVKVRIFGYHTEEREDLDTDELMWAVIMLPTTSASISGVGYSPTGMVEGTHVVGFFLDGENAQSPIIMGTILGIPQERKPEEGFFDPNGVYPRDGEGEFWHEIGESDCNRLTRNEKIDDTIIKKKLSELDESDRAFGGDWFEKPTCYESVYPYNHVYESESGHIKEYDDTEGAERIGEWHRTGTFYEIHPDGSRVEKIVKDDFEVIIGDDHCHIHGKCNVTIESDSNVLINGNANVEVNGDANEMIAGDYKLKIGGDFIVEASKIDLNPPEGVIFGNVHSDEDDLDDEDDDQEDDDDQDDEDQDEDQDDDQDDDDQDDDQDEDQEDDDDEDNTNCDREVCHACKDDPELMPYCDVCGGRGGPQS